jgi:hypothetical protein
MKLIRWIAGICEVMQYFRCGMEAQRPASGTDESRDNEDWSNGPGTGALPAPDKMQTRKHDCRFFPDRCRKTCTGHDRPRAPALLLKNRSKNILKKWDLG